MVAALCQRAQRDRKREDKLIRNTGVQANNLHPFLYAGSTQKRDKNYGTELRDGR